MAADDIDRAALFAAYRTAFAPTHERREQVLARLHRSAARPVVGSSRPAHASRRDLEMRGFESLRGARSA